MEDNLDRFHVVPRSSSNSNRLPKQRTVSSALSDDNSNSLNLARSASYGSSPFEPVQRRRAFTMLAVPKRKSRSRTAAYYPQLISSRSTAPKHLSFRGLDAYHLLTVDLPVCRIGKLKTTVALNDAAETSGINKRRIRIRPRLSEHPAIEQIRYFDALKAVRGVLLPMKRELRSLYKEGDSSDAFLTNVINPVCAVLYGFIAPHLRSLLRIEVQSQATYGYGKEDKENFVGNSYLDHALVLVDRKVADTVKPTFRIPILVVEHKTAGLIQSWDWSEENLEDPKSKERTLLAQILLYAHQTRQPRFLLSDYLKTVAFHVDWSAVRGNSDRRPLSVTYEVCSNIAMSKRVTNPAQRGIRNAVCYEAVQSLRDLGVADWSLLGIAVGDQHLHREIDDEIKVALGL